MTETTTMCRVCGEPTRWADGYGPIHHDTHAVMIGGEYLADLLADAAACDPDATVTDCRTGLVLSCSDGAPAS